MASHSSILAWRIPWTEELCGPQSMGSQIDTCEPVSYTKDQNFTRIFILLYFFPS